MKSIGFYIAMVCLCVSMSYASWQNTVFLGELNDYQNELAAGRVCISSDENSILFVRHDAEAGSRVWQAERDPETGLFDSGRMLSELKNAGKRVYGAWMSEDKLRLYYAGPDPSNLGSVRRPIWLATRSNTNEPWQTIERLNELEVEPRMHCPSLTADEKVILYEAVPESGGVAPKQIMMASRPSILHDFSNIHEVVELEAIGAAGPMMSPDGLKVYFVSMGDSGLYEYWQGSRVSREEPFGDFSPITEINANTTVDALGWMSPSWDGKKLYYHHRRDVVGDVYTCGIYMSEWVDDHYADAVRLLQEATADKEQVAKLLRNASDKEQTAMQILEQASVDEIPAEVSQKDIQQSLQSIRMDLQKQRLIGQAIEVCLQYLDTACLLLPPLSAQ